VNVVQDPSLARYHGSRPATDPAHALLWQLLLLLAGEAQRFQAAVVPPDAA
jgi:hypothetical protein